MPTLPVPATPTAEYSSLRNTFSTSRLAIMLPAVALRSPARTTPWSQDTATIVVPCGRSRRAVRCGPGRGEPAGQQPGRVRPEEVGERRGLPAHEAGRRQGDGAPEVPGSPGERAGPAAVEVRAQRGPPPVAVGGFRGPGQIARARNRPEQTLLPRGPG